MIHPYPHIRIDSKQILPAFLPGLGQRQVRLPGVLQERKHNNVSFSSGSMSVCAKSMCVGASTVDFMFTELSDCTYGCKSIRDTSDLISCACIHGHIWHHKYRFTYIYIPCCYLHPSQVSKLCKLSFVSSECEHACA